MTKEKVPEPNKNENIITLQIDIDEETAQGRYSNLALSNFSKEEVLLDFALLQPGMTKGKVRARIIITPRNTKKLAAMLQANIIEYEKKFGILTDEGNFPSIKLSGN